jgi:hypothetical protein
MTNRLVLHDRALVVGNLPTILGLSPKGRSTGDVTFAASYYSTQRSLWTILFSTDIFSVVMGVRK